MNLDQLIKECQHWSAEVTDAFFTPEMWTSWLNEAQMEFARETKILQRIAETTTVVGQQAYPLDPDFYLIRVVRFENRPALRPIAPYEMESYSLSSGIPTRYLVTTDRIFLWPTPSTVGKLVVWYYASPVEMRQPADEPEIPRIYHSALVPGAVYRALRADKDYSGADRFEREWREHITAAIFQQQDQQEHFARVLDVNGSVGDGPWHVI